MKEEVREDARAKLSALMDGELGDFEVRLTLKMIADDPELKQIWYRYQLASAAMRKELPEGAGDLSASIRSAIDAETVPRKSLLSGTFGRVVIAASVAVFTVLGVQYLAPLVGGATPGLSGSVLQTADGARDTVTPVPEAPETPQFQLPVGFDLPQVRARTVSIDSRSNLLTDPTVEHASSIHNSQIRQFQERAIRTYVEDRMLRHTERTSLSSHQGMLPFARIPQSFDR